MNPKGLDLPETMFVRDIDSKVFQAITLQCLAKIEGISLLENNLIDSLLGREFDRVKGIYVEQDSKKHSVCVRIEINIGYGLSIPKKAEEIQTKIVKEITTLTGLHVASVHVIFKSLIPQSAHPSSSSPTSSSGLDIEKEYGEEF
ncbi:MAG: Asp23/Gls24 family envelope stress response protein [Chlamydiota bacterium]